MTTPVQRLARLLASAELPTILAIAPFLIFPTPSRLLVLGVVPVLWMGAMLTTGRLIPATPMNRPLSLMLVMVVVSLGATFDVRFSLGKVSGVLLGILLFWAGVRWVTSRGRLTAAVVAYVLAGVALAIIGLLGARWEYKFMGLRAVSEQFPVVIRGVPGAESGFNPNAVAGCLVLFVPLQLALMFAGSHRRVWPAAPFLMRLLIILLQAAGLLITVGALILMQSRGAWAGLALAGFAVMLWHGRRMRLAAAIAVLLPCLVIVFAPDGGRVDQGVERLREVGAARLADRMDIWSSAARTIQEFPMTGIGMNAFREVGPIRHPMAYPRRSGVPHAHNHILQAALDLGIPGLLAYLALWAIAGVLLVQVHRGSQDPLYRAMAGGLGAGGIAHFLFSLNDVIPLGAKVGVLFWLALALSAALHKTWRAGGMIRVSGG